MPTAKHILVIGANPAWQIRLDFEQFAAGHINRALSRFEYPAGKGTNAARDIIQYTSKFTPQLFYFYGGLNGEIFRKSLRQEKIKNLGIKTQTPTRRCITCLNHGQMTEIIEPAPVILDSEVEDMLDAIEIMAPKAVGIMICGAPPACNADRLYGGIAEIASRNHLPLLADTVVSVPAILQACPTAILKINAGELSKILNSKDDVEQNIQTFTKKYPRCLIGVTDEDRPAYLGQNKHKIQKFIPKTIPIMVSPLGAGDVASAVFFCELLQRTSPDQAFTAALDAASDSCTTA